jgi:nicotinamidase-related amidase
MDPYLQPELERAALLTIDLQRDTLDGQPCEIPGTSAIVPQVSRVADWFRRRGRPIVHVVRLYRSDGSNVDLCRRGAVENGARLFLAGSPGSQLASGVLEVDTALDAPRLMSGELQHVGEGEWILYKSRWGAFFKTRLEEHLRQRDVTTIVVVGCNYPNCPRTSLYQASERDFRLLAVSDAISRFDERAQTELEGIGVAVQDAAALFRGGEGTIGVGRA